MNFCEENKSNLGKYESFLETGLKKNNSHNYISLEDCSCDDNFLKVQQKEFFDYNDLIEIQQHMRCSANTKVDCKPLVTKLLISLERSNDIKAKEIIFWIIASIFQDNKNLIHDFIDIILIVSQENIMNISSDKVLEQILYMLIYISENMKLELGQIYFNFLLIYFNNNIDTNDGNNNCCLILNLISMNIKQFDDNFLRCIAKNLLNYLDLNDISILALILKILINIIEITDYELTDIQIHKIIQLSNSSTTILVENSLDLLINYSSKKQNINIDIHQIFNIKLSFYPNIFQKILNLGLVISKNSLFYSENVFSIIITKDINALNFESKKIVLKIIKISTKTMMLKEINAKILLFLSSLMLSDDEEILLDSINIIYKFKDVLPFLDENLIINLESLSQHNNKLISSNSTLLLNYIKENMHPS